MIGNGYQNITIPSINNFMSYLAWIIGGGIVAVVIYWLMDWQSQHEDGE